MEGVVGVRRGLSVLGVGSSGSGVGVPGRVSIGAAGLVSSGGLVGVSAVVGLGGNSEVNGGDGGNEGGDSEGLEHV